MNGAESPLVSREAEKVAMRDLRREVAKCDHWQKSMNAPPIRRKPRRGVVFGDPLIQGTDLHRACQELSRSMPTVSAAVPKGNGHSAYTRKMSTFFQDHIPKTGTRSITIRY